MNNVAPNLMIRPACTQDMPRIREIAAQAWEPIFGEYRRRIGEELYQLEMPGDRLALKADEVSSFYEQHSDWCLAAELDDQVVGFMTFVLQRDKSIGEISNNAVDPDCQSHGVGTAQCRRVLEIFRQDGMKYAKVHTGLDPAHAPARAIYVKGGFTEMIPYVKCYQELHELSPTSNIHTAIVIRPARGQDVPGIREIAATAWGPMYDDYRERMGEELYQLDMPDDWRVAKADEETHFFEQHPDWCLVTELDGQIVGYTSFLLYPAKSIGEVGQNAVNPAYQGRGVGTAQYRRVLEIFGHEGMKYAKVHTGLDRAHAPARAAYEKAGFKQVIPHAYYYRKL